MACWSNRGELLRTWAIKTYLRHGHAGSHVLHLEGFTWRRAVKAVVRKGKDPTPLLTAGTGNRGGEEDDMILGSETCFQRRSAKRCLQGGAIGGVDDRGITYGSLTKDIAEGVGGITYGRFARGTVPDCVTAGAARYCTVRNSASGSLARCRNGGCVTNAEADCDPSQEQSTGLCGQLVEDEWSKGGIRERGPAPVPRYPLPVLGGRCGPSNEASTELPRLGDAGKRQEDQGIAGSCRDERPSGSPQLLQDTALGWGLVCQDTARWWGLLSQDTSHWWGLVRCHVGVPLGAGAHLPHGFASHVLLTATRAAACLLLFALLLASSVRTSSRRVAYLSGLQVGDSCSVQGSTSFCGRMGTIAAECEGSEGGEVEHRLRWTGEGRRYGERDCSQGEDGAGVGEKGGEQVEIHTDRSAAAIEDWTERADRSMKSSPTEASLVGMTVRTHVGARRPGEGVRQPGESVNGCDLKETRILGEMGRACVGRGSNMKEMQGAVRSDRTASSEEETAKEEIMARRSYGMERRAAVNAGGPGAGERLGIRQIAHVAMVCVGLRGHLGPMVALAEELARRGGMRITFATDVPEAQVRWIGPLLRLEAEGFPLRVVRLSLGGEHATGEREQRNMVQHQQQEHPFGEKELEGISHLPCLLAAAEGMRRFSSLAAATAPSLLSHFASDPPSIVVRDTASFAGAVLAREMGPLPILIVNPSAYFDPRYPDPPHIPAFGTNFQDPMKAWELALNWLVQKATVSDVLLYLGPLAPLNFGLIRRRLRPFLSLEELIGRHSFAVFQSSWGLEVPRRVPPQVSLVGPMVGHSATAPGSHKDGIPPSLRSWLDAQSAASRPIVYVSFGTTTFPSQSEWNVLVDALLTQPPIERLSHTFRHCATRKNSPSSGLPVTDGPGRGGGHMPVQQDDLGDWKRQASELQIPDRPMARAPAILVAASGVNRDRVLKALREHHVAVGEDASVAAGIHGLPEEVELGKAAPAITAKENGRTTVGAGEENGLSMVSAEDGYDPCTVSYDPSTGTYSPSMLISPEHGPPRLIPSKDGRATVSAEDDNDSAPCAGMRENLPPPVSSLEVSHCGSGAVLSQGPSTSGATNGGSSYVSRPFAWLGGIHTPLLSAVAPERSRGHSARPAMPIVTPKALCTVGQWGPVGHMTMVSSWNKSRSEEGGPMQSPPANRDRRPANVNQMLTGIPKAAAAIQSWSQAGRQSVARKCHVVAQETGEGCQGEIGDRYEEVGGLGQTGLGCRVELRNRADVLHRQTRADVCSVRVEEWVPQASVLWHEAVEVAVTAGGANSSQEAIVAGIPQVLVPYHNDQFLVSSQVARAGAGIVLSHRHVTTTDVHAALQTILSGPRFKRRVNVVAALMREGGGTVAAADRVELALALGYEGMQAMTQGQEWRR